MSEPVVSAMYVGEGFAGEGPDAAHINLLIGPKNGPVGAAFASGLTQPRPGNIPFLSVIRPNVPAIPPTLFVNKADLRGPQHEALTWGAAQAGVASGISEALLSGELPAEAEREWVAVAAAWVNWIAADAESVFRNNREATLLAVRQAMRGVDRTAIADAVKEPRNAYFRNS